MVSPGCAGTPLLTPSSGSPSATQHNFYVHIQLHQPAHYQYGSLSLRNVLPAEHLRSQDCATSKLYHRFVN